MQVTTFWDIAACSLVDVDRRFRGALCPNNQDETTRRCIPESCHLKMYTLHRCHLLIDMHKLLRFDMGVKRGLS
jgi:hypothetical protein